MAGGNRREQLALYGQLTSQLVAIEDDLSSHGVSYRLSEDAQMAMRASLGSWFDEVTEEVLSIEGFVKMKFEDPESERMELWLAHNKVVQEALVAGG